MGFEDILGHARPLAQLRAALAAGRLHQAYLFSGPDGVGKELVALRLAQALCCEAEPPEARPCGACSACRRIERGNHPDVVWMMPEAERVARKLVSRGELDRAPSRELRIAEVRAMEQRLRLPPHEGRHKVVVLTPADRMNAAAQNALLKTLEEPPSRTTLVLVTAAEGALLPTVRSRCARIVFAPLATEVVAAEVARRTGVDTGAARVLATLAGGSLGRALSLDPEAARARDEVLDAVIALDPADGLALTGFAQRFTGDREDADESLALVASWYRDVLALASGAPETLVTNADRIDALRAEAGRHTPRALVARLGEVAAARRAIRGNVNARLAVEAMVAGFGAA